MNSANFQREMEGNRKIISLEFIKINLEDRDTGNDSSHQWEKHTEKSGNLVVPIERREVAISRDFSIDWR